VPDRVVGISLLVAKSIEVGKSKATRVIFFLKRILVLQKFQSISAAPIDFSNH